MQTLSKKLAKYFPAHQNITLIANGLGLIEIFLVSIPKANSKFHSNSRDLIPQRDVAREGARNNYCPQN